MITFPRVVNDKFNEEMGDVEEIEARDENRAENETHRFMLPSASVIRRVVTDDGPLWEKRIGVREWGELNAQETWEYRFLRGLENSRVF